MKSVLAFAFPLLVFGGPVQAAKIQIPVVASYNNLDNEKVWKKVNQDEVPLFAIQNKEIEEPSQAFRSLMPGKNHSRVYLQNERMIVCYESCEKTQPELSLVQGKIELKNLDANGFLSGKTRDEAWRALKVLNVYYWSNRLFDDLAKLGYKPSRRLTVIVERNISDPGMGQAMNNNAFFTELDWSLNFLPVANSFLFKMMGMNIHSAALDPGVIIHEATHSVFQDLIGSILNPSLYGLHEALADYFAMSVLDTRKIGVIFLSGEPIRSADDDHLKDKPVYKPGLEVHAMGNIVNTALQRIKVLIPEKRLADQVVLETVKALGRDPYILATQIQATFMNSLARVSKAQGQDLSSETLNKISKIWKDYKIQSVKSFEPIPKSYFLGPKDTSGYAEVTVEVIIGEKVAKDWNLPERTVTKAGVLNSVEGPSITVPGEERSKKSQLMYVEVEDASLSVPLYLHHSEDGLMGAYTLGGQLLTPQVAGQKEIFEKLLAMNKVLGTILGVVNHGDDAGNTLGALFDQGRITTKSQSVMKSIYKIKDQQVVIGSMSLPSLGKIEVIKRTGKVTTRLLGKLANLVTSGAVGMTDTITVYTVRSAHWPQLKTLELFAGERLLGSEIRLKTGVVQKILISDFDADKNSVVLPAPEKVTK